MNTAARVENGWSIVLAAGEGERLKPFVRTWLGYEKPKQFCTFIGTRSLLQHTLDRADKVTPPLQKITLIAGDHWRRGWVRGLSERDGRILVQPRNRGTAAAIFLALTYIRRTAPHASVVLFPSDHFVSPEERFVDIVRAGFEATEILARRLILLAVPASRPDLDYGFIQVGHDLGQVRGHRLIAAAHFWEKPKLEGGRQALESGALWNTLIMISKVDFLWTLGERCFPMLIRHLEEFTSKIGTPAEEGALETLHRRIPYNDFSSELLGTLPEKIAVLELNGVLWSDWGRPERILETLAAIGRAPASALARAATA